MESTGCEWVLIEWIRHCWMRESEETPKCWHVDVLVPSTTSDGLVGEGERVLL